MQNCNEAAAAKFLPIYAKQTSIHHLFPSLTTHLWNLTAADFPFINWPKRTSNQQNLTSLNESSLKDETLSCWEVSGYLGGGYRATNPLNPGSTPVIFVLSLFPFLAFLSHNTWKLQYVHFVANKRFSADMWKVMGGQVDFMKWFRWDKTDLRDDVDGYGKDVDGDVKDVDGDVKDIDGDVESEGVWHMRRVGVGLRRRQPLRTRPDLTVCHKIKHHRLFSKMSSSSFYMISQRWKKWWAHNWAILIITFIKAFLMTIVITIIVIIIVITSIK